MTHSFLGRMLQVSGPPPAMITLAHKPPTTGAKSAAGNCPRTVHDGGRRLQGQFGYHRD